MSNYNQLNYLKPGLIITLNIMLIIVPVLSLSSQAQVFPHKNPTFPLPAAPDITKE